MFKLELYKNQDPARPLRFAAPNEIEVLRLIWQWMGRNYPSGLTLPVDDPEWPHKVILFWHAGKWYVAWGADIERRFRTFAKARRAFLDTCSYQVTVCEVTENSNSPGHG